MGRKPKKKNMCICNLHTKKTPKFSQSFILAIFLQNLTYTNNPVNSFPAYFYLYKIQ